MHHRGIPFFLMALALVSNHTAQSRSAGPPQPAVSGRTLIPAAVLQTKVEGYGAGSRGGQGGRLIHVTSLADSGPGSLREALTAGDPRIIHFEVGGSINLKKRILVRSGRVTLDGLSAAPYGGITVNGGGLLFAGCRDVVVRHIRLRGGYDPLSLLDSRHVLISHVSAAWATDENMDAWGSQDVTFQWCIMAEGLVEGGHEKGPHSMGSLQGGGATRVTTHHSLFTGNVDRNPLVYGPRPRLPGEKDLKGPWRFDVLNNLIYNYWNGGKTRFGAHVNFMGNVYRPGPQTHAARAEMLVADSEDPARLYCRDNLGPNRTPDDPELALVWLPAAGRPDGLRRWSAAWEATASFPARFIVARPFRTPRRARVQLESAGFVLESVLAGAGAWPRDHEDLRLIGEVRHGGGRIGRYGTGWRSRYEAWQREHSPAAVHGRQ